MLHDHGARSRRVGLRRVRGYAHEGYPEEQAGLGDLDGRVGRAVAWRGVVLLTYIHTTIWSIWHGVTVARIQVVG
jgi:hypothetical protein